ncbi:MAG: PAS domain-containing protein [Acidobacteria bacterium]|nr:PAS domain-containing protein [Acidobacteriota bacterium]
MSLRRRFILYLVLIHLFFGLVAVLLLADNRLLLIGVEIVFVLSLILGYRLISSLFVPLELISTGAELLAEGDFASQFRDIGQPEMDALIAVYNRMIESLREERLRVEETNLLLGRIIDASPSGIIILDFDDRIRRINPAAESIFDDRSVSLAGRRLDEIGHPLAGILAKLDRDESTIVSLDSGRRFRCRRAEYMDRGFSRAFFVVDELTEELRTTEKSAYEKLIRMISHEVANSVGAVRSLLESSLHYRRQISAADRTDYENAIEVSRSRLENLNRFVNAFADIVRLPAPELRPVSLVELMQDLAVLVRPDLKARNVRITVDVSEDPGTIDMDKNQIEQVLLNVLRNAAESIGRDGSIGMRIDRGAHGPELRILDSGPGISDEIEGDLFRPFCSTKRDGRGLGLTLAREILSSHGFDFSLRNREGTGAEFTIRF